MTHFAIGLVVCGWFGRVQFTSQAESRCTSDRSSGRIGRTALSPSIGRSRTLNRFWSRPNSLLSLLDFRFSIARQLQSTANGLECFVLNRERESKILQYQTKICKQTKKIWIQSFSFAKRWRPKNFRRKNFQQKMLLWLSFEWIQKNKASFNAKQKV